MPVAIIVDDHTILDTLPEDREILYEYRLDRDPQLLENFQNHARDNVILTLRSVTEGGAFDGDRPSNLKGIIQLKAKYIDLELATDFDMVEEILYATPILSKHDYSQPMRDAVQRFLQRYQKLGSANTVIKFVGKPVDAYDMLISLKRIQKVFPRHVILGIGRPGIVSRTLARDFNQEFVFGSLTPGEIPDYREVLPAHQDNAILTGLIGSQLDHSMSPIIHAMFRQQLNLPGYYHLFEIKSEEHVAETIEILSETYILGCNVTFPYKEHVRNLGIPDHNVIRSGVANTICFSNEITLHNTDISGFSRYYTEITEISVL